MKKYLSINNLPPGCRYCSGCIPHTAKMPSSKQLKDWGYMEGYDFVDALNLPGSELVEYDTRARNYLGTELSLPKLPLFKVICIETLNRCNGECSFCPANRHLDTREFQLMSEELLSSILHQLKEIRYNGYLALFTNNEPFMDKRIIGLLEKAKSTLPDCFQYLSTNGTLLSLDKFKEAMEYLDAITISNYSDDYEFIPTVEAIYKYCKENAEIARKVKIRKRKNTQQLATRGGQAPNRETIRIGKATCILPFQQLIVRPDGKVSLCAMMYLVNIHLAI